MFTTVTLAHPLTEQSSVGISPLLASLTAAALLLALAFVMRERPVSEGDYGRLHSWAGELTASAWVTRSLALGLLLAAIVGGRIGAQGELDNVLPPLLVALAWPALLVGCALTGALWRRLDPWDSTGRLARAPIGENPGDVYPAVLFAGAWAWYLSGFTSPLSPRSVALVAATYTLVTSAGCLLLGRRSWLGRAEFVGLLCTWLAFARSPGREWNSPRGAELVLGVLAGGLLFGALRRSELWGSLNVVPNALAYSVAGFTACTVLGVAMLVLSARRAAKVRDVVVAAGAPAVASIAVALALSNNRLFTAAQLLPDAVRDPLGLGWNLLGGGPTGLDPEFLGPTALVLAQLAVLTAGHFCGAVIVGRRLETARRMPPALALAGLFAVGVAAVTAA